MGPLHAQHLIGTWHLERWAIEYSDGRVTLPFGADAGGMLLYAADGGMSAAMYRRQRTALDAAIPARASLETRAAIVEEYLAYGGTWWLDGNVIVHRVMHSANPVLIGTEQRREAQLEGERLSLIAREPQAQARVHRIDWRRGAT
jgi:hypothetical protein